MDLGHLSQKFTRAAPAWVWTRGVSKSLSALRRAGTTWNMTGKLKDKNVHKPMATQKPWSSPDITTITHTLSLYSETFSFSNNNSNTNTNTQ